MRWHHMNYGLEKPKLSFLKGLGLRRLCGKVSGLSSNPKRIKCIFIGHPKHLGIPPNSDPKAIWIVSRIGSFLEEKFLSKELSGRMVETWWGYWTVSSTSVWQGTGVVPVAPAPIEVEAYDSDHETSDQVTNKPRGMTRMRTTSEWYVILSWKSCC